ncbi:MAG TPA: 2-oxoacid:acceptor oxidoreductase family protein [Bacillota bacterium]|nr:2-oxoacid:acceptor oxidoreductase family protein [Bacillota bacterium]HNT04020.1 2-oxoacid:acceptor oxidoreductase family protein [Bacillota bacterium]HPX68555.1 2-oxoacid:acceptor oxidoreductase family protein [Bacillota bacterium]HQA66464.1 2-oxoacid:acceptor oxidoreductase family protein [Bacillota bacterium]HQO42165.1 2-oxoacid:acceptor oxidoreductase family protein [Bacillota bacterium]
MKNEIIFSGVGGQGIMLIGKMLCEAAVDKGYQVTFAPTYGQEKRGGRTSCQIVISDSVDSPVISEADTVLIMDEKSLDDFKDRVKKGAYLIINSSMVEKELTRDDINVIKVPVNDIASEMGNPKSANIVALGVALKYIDSVSLENIKEYLGKIFKGSAIEKNKKALQTGYEYSV